MRAFPRHVEIEDQEVQREGAQAEKGAPRASCSGRGGGRHRGKGVRRERGLRGRSGRSGGGRNAHVY